MQFRQVDVYTKSEAIQVLVMRLSELGLNGFIIHDPADLYLRTPTRQRSRHGARNAMLSSGMQAYSARSLRPSSTVSG